MKKLIIITLLIFLIPLPAISGVHLWGMRGELWNKNSELNKINYVQGIFDGMVFSEFTVKDTKLSTDITVFQYKNAINTLYSDYKNSLIPVPFLLVIITLEIEGNDKIMVEKLLEEYRKYFSKKNK